MKGVILAAGKGTRLMPLTRVIPKVLLPVYNKPMIYYSIELLKSLGIDDIMIVASISNQSMLEKQLGDGSEFGVKLSYEVQKVQDGSGGAFKVTREFLNGEGCALLFADNVFLTKDFESIKKKAYENLEQGYSSIFTYVAEDPRQFGVLVTDKDGVVTSFEEKPQNPKSNMISTGFFFYDNTIFDKVDKTVLSDRGEYEMASVNVMYMEEKKLKAIPVENSMKWYDAGNYEALLKVSNEAKDFI